MGIEELKKEVLAKAKKQADAIIAEAKKEEQNILRQAKEKLAGYNQSADEGAEKAIEMIEKRVKASSELESKKMILEAKKEITEEVFSKAKKEIEGFSGKKRESHVKELIRKAKHEIEIGEIFANKRDLDFVEGHKAKEAQISGGIIAESKDGTTRVDYSYETILETVKEKNMQKIANILFQ